MAIVDLKAEEISVIRESLNYSKMKKRDGLAPADLTARSLELIDQVLQKLSMAKVDVE